MKFKDSVIEQKQVEKENTKTWSHRSEEENANDSKFVCSQVRCHKTFLFFFFFLLRIFVDACFFKFSQTLWKLCWDGRIRFAQNCSKWATRIAKKKKKKKIFLENNAIRLWVSLTERAISVETLFIALHFTKWFNNCYFSNGSFRSTHPVCTSLSSASTLPFVSSSSSFCNVRRDTQTFQFACSLQLIDFTFFFLFFFFSLFSNRKILVRQI